MNKTLVQRQQTAIKKIGGAPALLDLPEEIRNILRNTNDLETKVKMLELIADNKDAVNFLKENSDIFKFYM